jgi:hypothetical protein
LLLEFFLLFLLRLPSKRLELLLLLVLGVELRIQEAVV